MFLVLAVGGKHQARWTSKQDAWDWAGSSGRQRVCTCAWGIHKGACEPRDCPVCTASDLLPLSAQREEKMWLSLNLMWVLYTDAVEGSTLFMAVFVTGPVSVLCVHVSGIHIQFCYWLYLEIGKEQLLRQPGSPGWAPVTAQRNLQTLELLEEAAACNIP